MSDVQPTVRLQETSPRAEARGHPEVSLLPQLLEMDQPARSWRGLLTETELRRAHDDSVVPAAVPLHQRSRARKRLGESPTIENDGAECYRSGRSRLGTI